MPNTNTANGSPRRAIQRPWWTASELRFLLVRRAHLLVEAVAHQGPGTAAARFKALHSLYRWLEEEGEIPDNAITCTRSLHIPEQPVPIVPAMPCDGCSPQRRRVARP